MAKATPAAQAATDTPAGDTLVDTPPATDTPTDATNGSTAGRGAGATFVDITALDPSMFVDEADIPVSAPRGGAIHGPSDRWVKITEGVKALVESNPAIAGKFIEVAKFATNQGANNILRAIKQGKVPVTAGAFSLTGSKFKRADGKGNGSAVWVSYSGDGELHVEVTEPKPRGPRQPKATPEGDTPAETPAAGGATPESVTASE